MKIEHENMVNIAGGNYQYNTLANSSSRGGTRGTKSKRRKFVPQHSEFYYKLETLTDKIHVFKNIFYSKSPKYQGGSIAALQKPGQTFDASPMMQNLQSRLRIGLKNQPSGSTLVTPKLANCLKGDITRKVIFTGIQSSITSQQSFHQKLKENPSFMINRPRGED